MSIRDLMRLRVSPQGIVIVIIVLAFIVAALLPEHWRPRRKRRLTMINIMIALESYHRELKAYPPDTGPEDADGDGFDPCSLYRYLCGPDSRGIKVTRHGRTLKYGPYLVDYEWFALRAEGDSYILLDRWNRPWVYEENWSHTRKQPPKKVQAHNPQSYDLYSLGADGKKDPGHDFLDNDGDGEVDERDELVDDVTNW